MWRAWLKRRQSEKCVTICASYFSLCQDMSYFVSNNAPGCQKCQASTIAALYRILYTILHFPLIEKSCRYSKYQRLYIYSGIVKVIKSAQRLFLRSSLKKNMTGNYQLFMILLLKYYFHHNEMLITHFFLIVYILLRANAL